jgi:hypothetical protein
MAHIHAPQREAAQPSCRLAAVIYRYVFAGHDCLPCQKVLRMKELPILRGASVRCLEARCLPRWFACAVLFELLDNAFEIGIAGAQFPREPVAAALDNPLAIRDHLELTGFTRRSDGFNAQAILDEVHETRDLGFVALSRGTVNDFDFHLILQSARRIRPVAQSACRAIEIVSVREQFRKSLVPKSRLGIYSDLAMQHSWANCCRNSRTRHFPTLSAASSGS